MRVCHEWDVVPGMLFRVWEFIQGSVVCWCGGLFPGETGLIEGVWEGGDVLW